MDPFILFPLMTALFAIVHVAASREARSAEGASRALLTWAILFNVGAAGLIGFAGHAFAPERAAAYIGWAPGGPFQYEVACANLAFGALGVLCLFFGDMFRLATIVGQAVFFLGAAYGHLREIQTAQNMAPGNAGPALYADIIVPPVLLILWIVHRVMRERALRRQAPQKPQETHSAYADIGDATRESQR